MSMQDDGGPAFPRRLPEIKVSPDEAVEVIRRHAGMSLRDYFAAKAMEAIRADEVFVLRHDPEQVADRAYELADAMLRERSK